MVHRLPPALSLTAGGTALVTSGDGTIAPDVTAGLFVDDRRALSQWRLDAIGGGLRLVSRFAASATIDCCSRSAWAARSIRWRCSSGSASVEPRRLVETFTLTTFGDPVALRLQLAAARDDAAIYALDAGTARGPVAGSPGGVTAVLSAAGLADVEIVADGWEPPTACSPCSPTPPGAPWTSCVAVEVPGDRYTVAEQSRLETTSQPPALAQLLRRAHEDLAGLTVGVAGGGSFTAAGSPFFLALFGRDSMIAGMQSLLGAPGRLLDSLDQLAAPGNVRRPGDPPSPAASCTSCGWAGWACSACARQALLRCGRRQRAVRRGARRAASWGRPGAPGGAAASGAAGVGMVRRVRRPRRRRVHRVRSRPGASPTSAGRTATTAWCAPTVRCSSAPWRSARYRRTGIAGCVRSRRSNGCRRR